MHDPAGLVDALGAHIDSEATDRARDWWNRYLKDAIEFRGVPMAGVRTIVHDLWRKYELDDLPRHEQLAVVLAFFEEPYAEAKLAAILVLGEILLERLDVDDVDFLAQPFERGLISEWSTCDWYCVKVLGKVVARATDPRAAAERIAAWRAAPSLWQRRAAAVAFVDLAPRGGADVPGLPALILGVCAANARDPERFSQTSVGWVLRELSHAEPELVASFVDGHLELLSREARNMATAKLPHELRGRLNPSGRRR